ncbi:NAD-dependent epimerase/dehydratase family protein [Acuticoccus yangtzensis]|uniref:NAD-dependent epimerase/dehydratase family protein n=1 Tax=Acuticoccus yangtzensis TaxID=1443441 RepID=UPI0009495B13|nr:NAD-dependent epimerase/dehydratase family protein [Acuticoccus yangtzensis]
MTHVLITGAAGFIGRAVVDALAARVAAGGSGRLAQLSTLTLFDRAPANARVEGAATKVALGNMVATDLAGLVSPADIIIHLAASLTLAAETDVPGGFDINLHAALRLIEAAGRSGRHPVLVFSSSIAVFGGALPERVSEATRPAPATCYGTAKAMVELALADATRRGAVDGRTLRIPIVVTRPGVPTSMVSDIVAELIRGPLLGRDVVSPLDPDRPFAIVTAERVSNTLLDLAERPAAHLPADRVVHQPGLTVTPRMLVDSLARVAGTDVAERVTFAPDPAVAAVVAGWPSVFASDAPSPPGADADVDKVVAAAARRFFKA